MQEIEIAFAPVGSGEAEPRDEKKQSDKDDERDPLEEAPGSSGAKPRPPNLTPVEWLAPSEIDRADRKAATRRHEQAAFVVAVTRDRKLQLELEAIDLPQRAIGIRITRL